MKNEEFNMMLNSGEFERMFNENRINDLLKNGSLSKDQIDKLVDLGKKMSKDEILRRQRDLARQPGYKEHVLTPLIKKIIAQQGRARDPQTGRYVKQGAVQSQPEPEAPSPDRTAEKADQMKQKFKPKRMKNMFSGSRGATESAKPAASKVNTDLYSKIGLVQTPRLRKGDNASTIAVKIYSILKNDIDEETHRKELKRNFGDIQEKNELRRHKELMEAFNKAGGVGAGAKAKTGMGLGTKMAVGAGLLGLAGFAAAAEKTKVEPPVTPPGPTPTPAPVPPKVNVEEETRRKQQEAERAAEAEKEKQKREAEKQAREEEQKRKEEERKKEAENKKKEQEDKKKAEKEQKNADEEEAIKRKEKEDEDKKRAAEAKAKAAREEKERKSLEAEEKRKKDAAEKIAKAEADGQKREAERLRREEEKTAREEAARIKKEREDAEKEADAQKKEDALRLKKQLDARLSGPAKDYVPPKNGPKEPERPYDESIGRRYPKPIVRPSPTAVPQFRTPGEAHMGQQGYTPISGPTPVTKVNGPGSTEPSGNITTARKISANIGKRESGSEIPIAYNTLNGTGRDGDKPYDVSIEGFLTNKVIRGAYDVSSSGAKWIWNENEKKGHWDLTQADRFKENLTEMSIGEVMILQKRRSEKMRRSSGGSAAGRYQFIQSTMEDRAKLLFGPNYKNIQFSESVQEALQDENLIAEAEALKSAKIPINERNLYLMHFKGQANFVKEILSADPKKLVMSLDSWRNVDTEANRSIANMTIGDYLKSLNNFSTESVKLEDLGKSKDRYKPISRGFDNRINVLQRTDTGEKYQLTPEGFTIIPPKEKPNKGGKVSIFINAGQTILASNKQNSTLSIPTDPDNNVYYPYAA